MEDSSEDSNVALELGGENKVDAHEQLAAEVYGVADGGKFSTLGLQVRQWVRQLGAEENGIERIPPESRKNQNPRGIYHFRLC
jgi:hypothetical protein